MAQLSTLFRQAFSLLYGLFLQLVMWNNTAGGDTRAENLNDLKTVVRLERKVLHHLCYVVW